MSIDAVILAAGYSSRANGFKMELKIADKALLQHVIDAFIPHCNQVIIVGGYQIERLVPLLNPYKSNVKLVNNPEYDKGMFSSVKEGIKQVTGDRFFLTPGDCAFINNSIVKTLKEQNQRIIIPRFKGRGGHPIIIGREYITEIMKEDENSNLKNFLNKKNVFYIDVNTDNILFDVDTEDDYITAMNKWNTNNS